MYDQNGSSEDLFGSLVPTNGKWIRIAPDLEEEIGRGSAKLLLLIDDWLASEGFERDGYWWIKKSAQSMSDYLARTWTANKVKRELHTLAKKRLIVMARFDAPQDRIPYIRFDLEAVKQLKSIQVVERGSLPTTE